MPLAAGRPVPQLRTISPWGPQIGKGAFYSYSLDNRKPFFPRQRRAGCGIDAI
jgi:hypothetical protein